MPENRIPDKVDIQETISRYHEAASTYDLDQLVATFVPNGIWEVPSMDLRAEGADALRQTMAALIEPIEYLVQINAPAIIEVEGDTASARSLVRECAQFRNGGVYMDVVGRFNDRLERTADGWRFSHRAFTIIGTQVTEGQISEGAK
jgi:ketosteroid isomerase-like protein